MRIVLLFLNYLVVDLPLQLIWYRQGTASFWSLWPISVASQISLLAYHYSRLMVRIWLIVFVWDRSIIRLAIIDLFIFFLIYHGYLLIKITNSLTSWLLFEKLKLFFQSKREISCGGQLLLTLLSAVCCDWCTRVIFDVFFVVKMSSFSLIMINLLR
jgi:hypothetical protein